MTGFKYNKIRVCNILNSVKINYFSELFISGLTMHAKVGD